jgi:hypothetical protein
MATASMIMPQTRTPYADHAYLPFGLMRESVLRDRRPEAASQIEILATAAASSTHIELLPGSSVTEQVMAAPSTIRL